MPLTSQQFFNLYGYWRPGEDPNANPPWIPTFEEQHFVTGVSGIRAPLNPEYFATDETAKEVMRRFGARRTVLIPYLGSGGPEKSDAIERWVAFDNGKAVNAGKIAVLFLNSPENLYPNVAEHAAWRAIESAGVLPPIPF